MIGQKATMFREFTLLGITLLMVIIGISLGSQMVSAQDQDTSTSQIERETPVNVPELIEKVKRGVIVVHTISSADPFATRDTGLALGSGFIIDKDGHAITNFHVAGDSAMLQVVFWDQSKYRASLVAGAPGYDIALIQIHDVPKEKLFPVTLGDSDLVKPGDLALAMGSPGSTQGQNVERSDWLETWGLRATATMRVITGRDTTMDFQMYGWSNWRSGLGLDYATKLPYIFRMQVPISGGNSGGPSFNKYGEVIGVNTWGGSWILDQQSNGAVPINYVKKFISDVLENRRHEVPWLGIHVVFPPNINDLEGYIEFKERFRKPGLHIYGVEKSSPAERAGLLKGDEILLVKGKTYKMPEDFRADVLEGKIGERYDLLIKRGRYTLSVTLYTEPKPQWVFNFSV